MPSPYRGSSWIPGRAPRDRRSRQRLLIDGILKVAAVGPTAAGTRFTLTVSVKAPAGGRSYSRSFQRAADRFMAIGLDANQFSDSLLVGKRAVVNAQQLNRSNGAVAEYDNEKAVGGLLDLAIAQYFSATDADEASLALLTSAVPDRSKVALGIATSAAVLSDPTPDTARLQFPYLPADMGIDVPWNVWGAVAIDASTREIDLVRDMLLGYTNSSLEGLVLEELTNCESVSTMKAFQLAATNPDGKIALVKIDRGNVGNIATLLPYVRDEIRTRDRTHCDRRSFRLGGLRRREVHRPRAGEGDQGRRGSDRASSGRESATR